MNPLSLRATNYRTFETLALDLPEGCLAVIGANGAGKSSIVNVIDLALFGPEGRSLADYLADDGDSTELEIELTFEHAGELYRVRRGFSAKGRGKTVLDFECHDTLDDFWEPLTRESQKETQAAIEAVLGLSRETFRASAFLAQGDGAAFTEAQPRERKAILAEVLGLSSWDRLLEACRVDKRTAEREQAELAGRMSLLEERGGDLAALAEAKLRAEEVVSDRLARADNADRTYGHAIDDVSALERAESEYAARKVAYEAARVRLDAHAQIADDAIEARQLAAVVEDELAALPTQEQMLEAERDLAELRDAATAQHEAHRDYDERKTAYKAAFFRRNDLLGRASARNEEAHTLRLNADEALAHVGEARCDVCNQVLGQEAAEATAKRYREQAETFDQTARELDAEAEAIELPDVGDEPSVDPELAAKYAAAVDNVERVRAQWTQRPRLEERLAGYDAKIARAKSPEYLLEFDALKQKALDAAAAFDDVEQPEPGALDAARVAAVTAKASLDIAASSLREARENLIRASSALEQAMQVADELRAARERRAELQDELELLALLERAYGRDGIPALIVESSAIPQIETEANRILAELGTSYRVELHTQRELKSGDGLADTLDVVVIGESGARSYETFSGGERTRINLALRIALARLLAHRRGAESRLLAIDEPEFLDEAGTAALAAVLRGLEDEFSRIVLVSHVPTLREAFDTTIAVEKIDGRSVIAAA